MQSHVLPLFVVATLASACGVAVGADSFSSGGGGSGGEGSSGGGGGGGSTAEGGSASSATSTGGASGGSGGSMVHAPTVTSTTPVDGALGVLTSAHPSATFSEKMDCPSLHAAFTVSLAGTAIPGSVSCSGATATFRPLAHLPISANFIATIATGAKSSAGVHLAASHVWNFTTAAVVAGPLPVNLGEAADYAILAKAAISTVPTSAITGNLGVSPAAATFITGFSLTADASGVFSRSPQVNGMVFAADYTVPTPSNLTTAVGDMELAFTDAAGRAPDVTELGAGNIGGMTLTAGVYKWGTGLLIPTDVTLDGNANDVWILQVAGDLTMSSGKHVGLSGGARSKNVFWQVTGLAEIGTGAHIEGIVMTQTAVTLGTGASVNGRLLAQTAVSIDGNAIVQPAP